MNDYSDNEYWKALAERFFEAGTSEEEERELRRFIASGLAGSEFNDVRAVMGLAAVGARRYHRRRRRTVFLSAAAAAVSTKDPTRDSDLVWLMTSCVMMPMKRMFMPSTRRIL